MSKAGLSSGTSHATGEIARGQERIILYTMNIPLSISIIHDKHSVHETARWLKYYDHTKSSSKRANKNEYTMNIPLSKSILKDKISPVARLVQVAPLDIWTIYDIGAALQFTYPTM